MPGGRGLLSDIAVALNSGETEKVENSIKMAIDNGEYDINASIVDIGKAYGLTTHYDELESIWCLAMDKDAVIWVY